MVLFDNDMPGASRLDAIYKQIQELNAFKDEIMDELEEFDDDFDKQTLVTVPEEFEGVVDIVVNEQRERTDVAVN